MSVGMRARHDQSIGHTDGVAWETGYAAGDKGFADFHRDAEEEEGDIKEQMEKRERKTSRQSSQFAKDVEKKVQVLKKRMTHTKPRQHSKSCHIASPNELTAEGESSGQVDELDRIVQRLQQFMVISDARMPYGKNSRKSRTGRRGEVKKGGAGGHLVWGKPGEEISVDGNCIDKRDPNYDSELEDSIRLKMVVVPVSQADYERLVFAWIDEFFDHGNVEEVCDLLRDLAPTRAQLVRFPYLAISMALEKKPMQCELTSQLLSAVCDSHGLLNHALMEQAFDLLLKELDDLVVDLPDAPELVGCFIARAIADDVIPPVFVENHKGKVSSDVIIRALRKAANLLHIPHSYAHLDTVWLGAAGVRDASLRGPTKHLSRAFALMLKEYMDAKDTREVDRTLRELDSPHFLHELVFQAVMLVIERSTEEACRSMVDLLHYLYTVGECSHEMIVTGVSRIYADLADISLDVPSAYLIMDRFLKHAQARGVLSADMVKEMPRKKRPRFISECPTSTTKEAVKATGHLAPL